MNEAIFRTLNSLATRSNLFDRVVVFVADPLVWITIVALIAYALLRPHGRRDRLMRFMFILVGAVVAWGFASFIKDIIAHARPFIVLPNVRELIGGERDFSFPSGHTTFMFALATGLYYHHRKWGVALGALALAVGVARIVAGVHWPLDIAGGIILGGCAGYGLQYFIARFRK